MAVKLVQLKSALIAALGGKIVSLTEALGDTVVEEPGRCGVDDLVAFIADGAHRDLEARERAVGQRDVFLREGDAPPLSKRGDDGALRLGHVHLVGEPVLSFRLAPSLDGRDVLG